MKKNITSRHVEGLSKSLMEMVAQGVGVALTLHSASIDVDTFDEDARKALKEATEAFSKGMLAIADAAEEVKRVAEERKLREEEFAEIVVPDALPEDVG